MHSYRKLFIVAAIAEGGTGVALLSIPTLVIRLLLGIEGPLPETLVVARVAGTGLLAIGIACALTNGDRSSPSWRGLLWGLLAYNLGVIIVLSISGWIMRISGVALWPAVGIHVLIALWCAKIIYGK